MMSSLLSCVEPLNRLAHGKIFGEDATGTLVCGKLSRFEIAMFIFAKLSLADWRLHEEVINES